jgi:hypothetical protein
VFSVAYTACFTVPTTAPHTQERDLPAAALETCLRAKELGCSHSVGVTGDQEGSVLVTRTRSEEYRRLAEDCLVAARSTLKEDVRAALTDQAAHWFRLAQEQEEDGANIEGRQPVAQQQQQVQPKDDDKNE